MLFPRSKPSFFEIIMCLEKVVTCKLSIVGRYQSLCILPRRRRRRSHRARRSLPNKKNPIMTWINQLRNTNSEHLRSNLHTARGHARVKSLEYVVLSGSAYCTLAPFAGYAVYATL
ncbi:hypothetical protein T440DRAFT_107596 [Plenodomus tracheiphilus IPT5]|uniref:Uncharacterized protein n=1 Tax=Plenodomus tracheiphilus IPT5 TaxID=1408161 RepID=A0A6A7BLT4_9PLEO|nr:hypothetical protein T440DRAFT_107596 [Plenodomus tracheiphilus IPT5]